jgi:high-affinity nickel permease
MLALLTSCWLGFLIGLRHALDPDHLAAVSTLVADHPKSWRAAFLGTCWGLGHSAALLVAGGVLLAWRAQLPARWSEVFELGVSLMLIALGIRSLRRSLQARGSAAVHEHRGVVHVHQGEEDHFHLFSWTIARRPFLIGVAHGLAGTGGITALALASMPSAAAALLYIALFALGSIGGMALLTGIAGVPMERIARRPASRAALLACVGVASLLVGIGWGAPIAGRLLSF